MKETLGALGAGVAIAAIVACGGAKKSAMVASPGMAPNDAGGVPIGKHDPRIEELDRKISADFAALGAGERPPPPPSPTTMSVCTNPPCDATQTAIKLRKDDPTCKPGSSQVCSDTCRLSDSICENALKICEISKELGNDAWATEKCTSGTASCETAHGKCCGCS